MLKFLPSVMRVNAKPIAYALSGALLTAVFCLGSILPAKASADASKAAKMTFEPVAKISSNRLIIPSTDKIESASITFPAVKKIIGKTLCVRFKANLQMDVPGGWNNYLDLKLNNTKLNRSMPDTTNRLLNRRQFRSSWEGARDFWGGFNYDSLVTFFGPENGELDSRALSDHEEGYWYALNISDAVNYLILGADDRVESDIPNKLTFTNEYTLMTDGETASCHEMRISDIEVGYVPDSEIKILLGGKKVVLPSKLSGTNYKLSNSTLTLGKTGALLLNNQGENYLFSSGYSYPATPMGRHRFTWKSDYKDSAWKTQVVGDKVVGECAAYRVTRSVKKFATHYTVSDLIENKTNAPLGIDIQNYMDIASTPAPENLYLAGQRGCLYDDSPATHPSIYLAQKKGAVGMLAEDNLLRAQLSLASSEGTSQMGTNHFGLKPHASYTVEWSIYPMKDRDYFTFVNLVRRDWKVNFTIPGSFVFGDDGNIIQGRDAGVVSLGPWYGYATGEKYFGDDNAYKNEMLPKIANIKKYKPNTQIIGMIETNLIPIARNKFPDSEEILPLGKDGRDAGRGMYGREITAEQTQAIKNNPWWDCMLKTDDGRAIIDTYYTYDKRYFHLMVYPAPGNYQTQYMKNQIDFLMDKVGFGGIYIDQFTLMGVNLTSHDRCDYSKWDGHTVNLDDSGNITKMYYDACYEGIPARVDIIKHILAKKGLMVVNGHCVAKETRSLPFVRFAESEWNSWDPIATLHDEPPVIDSMAKGHLDTPVILGVRPDRFPTGKDHFTEVVMKWAIAGLKNGELYYYYASELPTSGPGAGEYGIINHMFPFTPVELHAGYLIGKERILTAKSGEFFWAHSNKPICRVFDLKGKEVKPQVQMTRKGNGWNVNLKINDWNEAAVITSAIPSEMK